MAWTPERVDELKKLWAEGLSASQIAQRLGDVTRNAVIGKVHRLGLSGRATTSRMKTVRPRAKLMRPRRARVARPGAEPSKDGMSFVGGLPYQPEAFEVPDELVIPLEERQTIATLRESHCRWPIGDPQHEDFHFCGKNKVTGTPYCEFHARKAFQPAQTRRRPEQRSIANGMK